MNADGSGQRRLTSGAAHDRVPNWSPDGRTIAFTGVGGIYTVHADGTGLRKLTGPGLRSQMVAGRTADRLHQ